MRITECSLLILILLTSTLPALASPWHPIETGHLWVYTGTIGVRSASIGSPVLFDGATVQPLEWDSGVREYLSEDGSGRVYVHGVRYPDDSYVAFRPPVLRMDSDLTPGHEWGSTSQAVWYDAGGSELSQNQVSANYQVVGAGPVEVGAGSFEAIELLHFEETGLAADRESAADPGPVRSFPVAFTEHYVENVGLVLRTNPAGTTVVAELQGFGQNGVSVRDSSLGALKSRFGK